MQQQETNHRTSKVRTEVKVVYDGETDCMVQRRLARLKVPQVISEVPLEDRIRAPLLEILRTQQHDRDPRDGMYCVDGDRESCTHYDELVRRSRRFDAMVRGKKAQAMYLNPPERVYLNSLPVFCEACIWVEHARRRREASLYRRFCRWLRPHR